MSKQEKKSQEVVVQQTAEVSVLDQHTGEQEILNSDVVIPRILLQQGLSEFVSERKKSPAGQLIAQGDMVKSTTADILGNPESPVEFIPLKMTTSWILKEKIGGKYEFRSIEPRTAFNEDAPWDFVKNGADWKRVKALNVFVLLPKDIENFHKEMEQAAKSGGIPDLSKALLPAQISFQSTSFNAGRAVATFYAQLRDMLRYNPGIKPYHYTLTLKCKQDKNDKGSYYVFDVGSPKKLDQKLVDEASRWYTILNTLKDIRVDTSGDDEAAPIQGSTHF